MDRAAADGRGEKRTIAGPTRPARETSSRLGLRFQNDCYDLRSAIAAVIRSVFERMGRPLPAHRGGTELSSRAARRTGRAYRANDARGERDCAPVSAVEPRSSPRRDFISRLRETVGERAAGKWFRHE